MLSLRLHPGCSGTLDLEQIPRGRRNGRDGRESLAICLRAGPTGFRGACSLVWSLPDGEQPWFMLPGCWYGDNRAVEGAQRWPCLGADDGQYSAPAWDLALDRCAAPLAVMHRDQRWLGLDWDPHYRLVGCAETRAHWGDSEPQIGVGLSWANGAGELRLNLPANEAPRRHSRNPHHGPTERQLNLPAGASLTFEVGLWDRAGDRHGYADIMRVVRGRLRGAHPPAALPPSAVLADCAAHGLLAWHWVDDPGYWVYTAAYDRSAEFNANNRGVSLGWHFEALGFVGGFPVAFGLLWQGGAAGRVVAERCLERWCAEGQSDWGFFRTSYHPGKARTLNGSFRNPAPTGSRNADPSGDTPFYSSCWMGEQELAHARSTADASWGLTRCLRLLGPGHQRFETWRSALRRSLEAALSVQDADGRFGQVYHLAQRQVRRHEGAGGLLWITACVDALPLFADAPEFQARLQAAAARAGAAYAIDVESEWIAGAPEDVDLAPTSEDGYNAILAYDRLLRVDPAGRERWLDLLQRAADWTLTWRKAYNVRFPAANILGSGNFRSVGGDFASCHNNHLHLYGCIVTGELRRLSATLGDPWYAERADDQLRFAAQCLSIEDGQWNGQRGMCTEQFYTSDWSIWGNWDPSVHHVQKGTLMGASHVWCINAILLGLASAEGQH